MATSVPLYTVQEVPNKGAGLIATTAIARGTRILLESPLIKVPFRSHDTSQHRTEIKDAISALSQDQRTQFFALHNSHKKYGEIEGRFRTNGFPLGGSKLTEVGIFCDWSRLNHSCIPNAHFNWNDNLKQLTVHALRDIAEDEEITISYLDTHKHYLARTVQLLKDFGFICYCSLCSLPSADRQASDERCNEIQEIRTSLFDWETSFTPLQALDAAYRLLKLLGSEGVTGKHTREAICFAFEMALLVGDDEKAKGFASQAAESIKMIEGADSPAAKEWLAFASDPSQY